MNNVKLHLIKMLFYWKENNFKMEYKLLFSRKQVFAQQTEH